MEIQGDIGCGFTGFFRLRGAIVVIIIKRVFL